MTERSLIFIVSLPRSGSTYLQRLLSNNQQVNTCSEPWILLNYAQHFNPKLITATFNSRHASTAFDYYRKGQAELNFRPLLKEHLLKLYAPLKGDFQYVLDKTPRYWEIVPEIAEMFPEARIIVLKRNPLDVVRSMIRTYDFTKIPQLVQFKRDLMVGPHKLHDFCEAQKDNPRVKVIRYEDLKEDSSNEVEQLYSWMNMPFSDNVLDVSNNRKHLGEYGDPYQNPESDEASGLSMKRGEINWKFNKLINGYGAYLGGDFLLDFGYDVAVKEKINTAFRYFRFLSIEGDEAASKRFRNALKAWVYALKFGKI